MVTIRPAKKNEQEVIENLMQLYLHDFSEFDDVGIDSNGVYSYPYLKFYWEDPNRFPFLIGTDGKLAGFALVRKEINALGQAQTSLAEYFILRRYRKLGLGREAAGKLWDLFPGTWTVEVLESNQGGYLFWKKIISQYKEQDFEEDNNSTRARSWTTFTFSS
jgi:predicted acetyltransferase